MVRFVDETTGGDRAARGALEIAEERLTLRELIRRRVFQEVAEHNTRMPEVFAGLVQPENSQNTAHGSNGYAMRTPRRVDPEVQTDRALKAFAANGFLVLVGDRQVTELDEEMDLALGAEVTFLKLVPLVGG